MRTLAFSNRCAKEILRDPLNLIFGIAFPVVLLLLLSILQSNIPVNLFEISRLAPAIAVFGLSFMTLFSATLIAKDKESAFAERLNATPLKSADFILGYMLPLIPVSVAQSAITFLTAAAFGLQLRLNVLYAILMTVPISILFVAAGLLCGSLLSVKQVGGVCGALFTNVCAWLSGIWFDISLLGDVFCKIANVLPFVHAVELERALISCNTKAVWNHLYPVLLWSVGLTVLAIFAFIGQKKRK